MILTKSPLELREEAQRKAAQKKLEKLNNAQANIAHIYRVYNNIIFLWNILRHTDHINFFTD